jgi:medium-chain acyl-[acyl-carrier-protein] hydrolase
MSEQRKRDRALWDIWVRVLGQTENVTARLFCLPYAGGGPSTFRSWVKHLPAGVQLCCLDLPGRERRIFDNPINDMEKLVRRIQEAVIPGLDLPYLVFGHSLGAIVAFELVQNLAAAGFALPILFMPSGAAAPHLPQRLGVHDLPDDAFLDFLRQSAGAPKALFDNPDLLELVLPTLRADFEITDRYVCTPWPRLTCPIVAFAGDQDRLVDSDGLAAWREHTSAAFRAYRPAGDHLYLRADDESFFSLLRTELQLSCSALNLALND